MEMTRQLSAGRSPHIAPFSPRPRLRVMFILSVLLGVSAIPAWAATWHVDKSAAGEGTGRNWLDAWTNLSAITWPAIQPGDRLLIAGDAAGSRYSEPLLVGASGTSNAPIVISLGSATGRPGPVILPGLIVGHHDWLTLDGSLDPDFAAPTNLLQLRTITNNIGLAIDATNGPAIYLTSPQGVKLRWIEVRQARRGTQRAAHGIHANMTRRGPTDHNQIKYCWIQNTDDDGIAWIANDPATHFGHQEVAFSIIENVGDDGLEANHGFTVHDCIIGPSLFLNGHPDGIQSIGSYWKIYNNEFHEFFNSWLRLQAVETNHHDVWVYNNLFLSGHFSDPKVSLYNTGIEVVQYAAWLGEIESMTWNRIVICNNTFFGAEDLVGGAINWAKRDEGTKAAFVHNVIVTNSLFVNNLVVECGRGASAWWQELKSTPPWGRAVHYDEQSLRWDYNVVAGSKAPEATRIGYLRTLHPTGELMARSSVWKHNVSTPVKFMDSARWKFELSPDDTAARDSGADLSDYFTHDILNRPRVGHWDRGAFESPR